METKLYIGSFIFKKTERSRELICVFNGARQVDGGWELMVSMIEASGYAGGSTTLYWQVKPGDTITLHPLSKAFASTYSGKQKVQNASLMRIIEITSDTLTVSFE